MKRFAWIALLAAVAFVAAPALAGEGCGAHDAKNTETASVAAGTELTMTGWVTDSNCGAKNANANGKDCIKSCAKNGAKLVFFSEGKMYSIDNQDLAMKHVGHPVKLTGIMGDDRTVKIVSMEQVKDDKQA
jgi:hypothetical protein